LDGFKKSTSQLKDEPLKSFENIVATLKIYVVESMIYYAFPPLFISNFLPRKLFPCLLSQPELQSLK
jgi:hypothetical protein